MEIDNRRVTNMRVISGSAKGHKLKKVPGDGTRPITDRVKENLFNILGDWVIGTHWLDLFAGTGQVGIEALSRGADLALFVDNSRLATRTIQANLKHTQLLHKAVVLCQDAFTYVDSNKAHGPFDVIYVAPPQYRGTWSKMLARIDQLSEQILAADGAVIVQIDPKEYKELALKHYHLVDRRKYGNTMLGFYEFS